MKLVDRHGSRTVAGLERGFLIAVQWFVGGWSGLVVGRHGRVAVRGVGVHAEDLLVAVLRQVLALHPVRPVEAVLPGE